MCRVIKPQLSFFIDTYKKFLKFYLESWKSITKREGFDRSTVVPSSFSDRSELFSLLPFMSCSKTQYIESKSESGIADIDGHASLLAFYLSIMAGSLIDMKMSPDQLIPATINLRCSSFFKLLKREGVRVHHELYAKILHYFCPFINKELHWIDGVTNIKLVKQFSAFIVQGLYETAKIKSRISGTRAGFCCSKALVLLANT